MTKLTMLAMLAMPTMLAMLAMRYVSLYWKTTPASIYNLVG